MQTNLVTDGLTQATTIPEGQNWPQVKIKCLVIFYTPCLSGQSGIVIACIHPSIRKLLLVRTITRHRFELQSPNLHRICSLGYSQLVLKMEVIDLDLKGHFGHFVLEFD